MIQVIQARKHGIEIWAVIKEGKLHSTDMSEFSARFRAAALEYQERKAQESKDRDEK